MSEELLRVCGHTLPSFALILYLLGVKGRLDYVTRKPQSRDFLALAIGLPFLFGLAMGISLLASRFGVPPAVTIEAPRGISSIAVMAFSCISIGYLEETFFRHYLPLRFLQEGFPRFLQLSLPTILFSLCHLYEGAWGMMNAAIAGVFLSILYGRAKTLHGLAWAHGLYNMIVFLMGT